MLNWTLLNIYDGTFFVNSLLLIALTQSAFACSKLTIKTPERRQWCRSVVFIVNFEHISNLFLVFLLLTLNMQLLAGNYFQETSISDIWHWQPLKLFRFLEMLFRIYKFFINPVMRAVLQCEFRCRWDENYFFDHIITILKKTY